MHYLQLRDETSEPSSLNVYRGVHEVFPELKTLLTVPSKEARPFVRIPCPQTQGFDGPGATRPTRKGSEILVVRLPLARGALREPDAAPDDAAAPGAVLADVVARRRRVALLGVELLVVVREHVPAGAKCQTTRLPAADAPNVLSLPDHPGDGFSIYPARARGSRCRRSAGSDPRRGGGLRVLLLLDSLIARAEKAGRADEVMSEAKATRESARGIVQGLTEYERRPEPYLKIRERVADAIEKLSK
jgi:hypothetical protein